MTIKKAYTGIMNLLEANREATVADIIDQAIEMASAKKGGGGGGASSFHRDEDGNIVAINCYYYKRWMNPSVVEFGVKSTSATKLNSMCKEGQALWGKQQRTFKQAKDDAFAQLLTGEITTEEANELIAEAEGAKSAIAETELGYATLEECLAAA